MLSNVNLRTQILLGFGTIILLMIVTIGLMYASVSALIETSGWVTHTYKAIGQGNNLVAQMVNQETGMRGFLVTGQDNYLEPYVSGDEEFREEIASTIRLVDDNPAQVVLLKEIKKNAENWQKNAAEVQIAERRKVSEGAAIVKRFDELRSRIVGKNIFDQMRVVLGNMNAQFLRENNLLGRYLIQALTLDLVNQETGQRGFLLTGIEPSLEPYVQGKQSFNTNLSQLRQLIKRENTQVSSTDIDRLLSLTSEWRKQAADPEIQARREVNTVPATVESLISLVREGRGKTFMDGLRGQVATFVEREAKLLSVRAKEAQTMADRALTVAVVGLLLALVLGVLISLWITRKVISQVGGEPSEIAKVAERVSKGYIDFNESAVQTTGINASLQKMVSELRNVISGAIRISGELEKNANELYTSSQNMSTGSAASMKKVNSVLSSLTKSMDVVVNTAGKTTEQAVSVSGATEELSSNVTAIAASSEETVANMTDISNNVMNVTNEIQAIASSMEQVSQSVSEISSNTAVAKGVSVEAKEGSEKNLKVMSSLGEKAGQIGQVVKMIEGIASQTNMLALNATIEAASAGEAGKGFAVVASEVKDLAQQTSVANNDIAKQIADIQSLVRDSLESNQSISSKVAEVANISGEINKAVEEQKLAVSRVSTASETISNSSQGISLNVQEGLQGLKEMNRTTMEVSQSAKNCARNSAEGASGAKEITQTSTQMAGTLEHVNEDLNGINETMDSLGREVQNTQDGIGHIASVSEELSSLISFFKLEDQQEQKSDHLLQIR